MQGLGLLFDGEHKRELTPNDLLRARIPARLQVATLEAISAQTLYRKPIELYLAALEENLKKGVGICFVGQKGRGKSGSAALITKEVLARGGSALFLEEDVLISAVLSKGIFDGEITIQQRAEDVDLLVIDDVGLSAHTEKIQITEILVKHRIHRARSVILTTNLTDEVFSVRYPTMGDAIKEACVSVVCSGIQWREPLRKDLQRMFPDA